MYRNKTVIRYVEMILSALNKDFVLKTISIYRRVTKTENQISRADAFIFWRHYYSARISPIFGVVMSYFLFISRFWIVSTLQYEIFLTQVGTEHHVGLNYYAFLCLWNMIINQSFLSLWPALTNIHSICFMNITYLHYKPSFHNY